jgi:cellobiose-specific phosphotransferase system component IIC
MFPAETEQTAGVGAMIPLTMIGSLAALVLAALRDKADPTTRAAMRVMLGAWLVMFGLAACWFIVARYTLDFALLMTMAAVVLLESSLERLGRPALLTAVVISLAGYSMFFGVALGFEGKDGAFRKQNPKVYQWMAKPFGTPRE